MRRTSCGKEARAEFLKERTEHTFQPNTVPDKLLTMIAKTVSETGDLRLGFQVLLTAGLLAERANKKTIDAPDITSAIRQESSVQRLKELEALKEEFLKLKKKHEKD